MAEVQTTSTKEISEKNDKVAGKKTHMCLFVLVSDI
jgi:hypothetical protein